MKDLQECMYILSLAFACALIFTCITSEILKNVYTHIHTKAALNVRSLRMYIKIFASR